MRQPIRWLLVTVIAALVLGAGALDPIGGRPWLGYLLVRNWLAGDTSPLAPWASGGSVPDLRVDLRTSPPLVDPAARDAAVAEYARLPREWAAARSADGTPTTVAVDRALPLLVHITELGCRAELPQPTGPPLVLERGFAGRWCLLPAVVAISVAVLTQKVLLALLLAGLLGAIAFVASTPGLTSSAFATTAVGVQHFFADALWRRSICDDFYLRVTLFVVFLFMAVGVLRDSGSVQAMIQRLANGMRGPVRTQLGTFAAGLLVFFDDYTNCLLVGSTMRPLCDTHGVSRQKLAYIVDSTAAPVAGISVFSTWVLYEISQYRAPLCLVTNPDGVLYRPDDAFAVFLQTMPFRCYCLFSLALVVLVILLRRDLGPMVAAERRARAANLAAARATNAIPVGAMPAHRARAHHAAVPLLLLVLGTLALMGWNGYAAAAALPAGSGVTDRLLVVLANSRSDHALLLASLAAWLSAVLLTLTAGTMTWRSAAAASLRATRPLGLAFGILFLAWSLGHVCRDLGTGFHLTALLRTAVSPGWLPAMLFMAAAAIAFATGTSFGTMAILLPNVVVLAHQTGTDAAFTGSAAAGGPALMLLCIGAVLEGSIFGDHCSPISDTTVLSAIGSDCDLLEHVRTQIPYALLAFTVSLAAGYLPLALLGPHLWPWCLGGGVVLMATALLVFGRNPDGPTGPASA